MLPARLRLPREPPPPNSITVQVHGYMLVIGAFLFFLVSTYALVLSKLMPVTGNELLDAVKYVRNPPPPLRSELA